MTTAISKTRMRDRSARMETKVEPRLYEAVDNFAVENGYTLSSAIYRILLDWEKNERRKSNRNKRK